MLKIDHLLKTYKGGKTAVKDLSLKVESGDIFGFIGHNGAGKTTTIKCIVGIHDFDEGEIWIDGQSINQNAITCKSKIAYIPDNPDVYEYLTGNQYLNFYADMYKIGQEEREYQIDQLARDFEIESALGDLVGSYSHGMKQKLVLISAFLHEPKLLILDEPFVGLDPKAYVVLKEKMHELCAKGSAIFFSTHVLDVAEKICNKVAIISNGQLKACGNMAEILNNESLESVFLEVTDHDSLD